MTASVNIIDDNITYIASEVNNYIQSCQLENGAIPWFKDGKLDPWDHIEAAMGLTIAGNYHSAKKAFYWLKENQNSDGSWYATYYGLPDDLDGKKIETNFVAYPACGLWHYYLITQDIDFVKECMPFISDAIDFVVRHQTKEGDIQWAISDIESVPKDALITACSSILRSLECAIALAKQTHFYHQHWIKAYQQLSNALLNKPWRFDRTWEPKTRFSMDWFYPIISGIYTQDEAQARIDARWKDFIDEKYGCRCVSDEPWMTVAESCELCLALIASGRRAEAKKIFASLLQWQDEDGGFWTGYSFRDHVIWPTEKTTWTAAAVLLAADALKNMTPASQLFTSQSGLLFP